MEAILITTKVHRKATKDLKLAHVKVKIGNSLVAALNREGDVRVDLLVSAPPKQGGDGEGCRVRWGGTQEFIRHFGFPSGAQMRLGMLNGGIMIIR